MHQHIFQHLYNFFYNEIFVFFVNEISISLLFRIGRFGLLTTSEDPKPHAIFPLVACVLIYFSTRELNLLSKNDCFEIEIVTVGLFNLF